MPLQRSIYEALDLSTRGLDRGYFWSAPTGICAFVYPPQTPARKELLSLPTDQCRTAVAIARVESSLHPEALIADIGLAQELFARADRDLLGCPQVDQSNYTAAMAGPIVLAPAAA